MSNPFEKLNLPDYSSFEMATPQIIDMASSFNTDMSEAMAVMEEVNRAEYERKEEVRANTKQMAEDTRAIKELFPQVIQNQNDYIQLLKQQLDISQKQLLQLKNVFYSQEDSDSVQKEILKNLSEKKVDIKTLSAEKLIDFIMQAIAIYLTNNGLI